MLIDFLKAFQFIYQTKSIRTKGKNEKNETDLILISFIK